MKVKFMPFEFKVNTDKRTIEGYASTYGNKDLVGDIVEGGAFKKTLRERKDKIKFLWQHDWFTPIGKPLHMEEDSKGLFVEAQFSKTQAGNDALTLADDGVLDSFSIGYDVVRDDYKADTATRHLLELKLYEFSLVTFPANEKARVSAVKSVEDFTKILKKTGSQDVTMLLKEGRTLSKANRDLIENAIKALEEVLAIAEPSEDTRKNDPQPPLNKITNDLGIDAKELADLLQNFKVKM